MASQQSTDEFLVTQVIQIHATLSKLDSLNPSEQVNTLFSSLLKLCTLPCTIDFKALPEEIQQTRKSLITLFSRVEGSLEFKFAKMLANVPQPLNNLNLYPYYDRYIKIASLEYTILKKNGFLQPKKLAFIGSGPMPMSSILMAKIHMKSTHFDNFDIDGSANEVASRIVNSDMEFAKRVRFRTCDVMEVKEELGDYDVVFLAALVGISRDEKIKIVGHLRKYMKEGGGLVVRSARGGGGFIYPMVEEVDLLGFEFEFLSVFHPTSDVMCSVLVRKPVLFG